MTEPQPRSVAALVLAAGASRRLGQPKQFVQLHGEPLVRRAARLALEAGATPVLVVGSPGHADALAAAITGLAIHPVENPNPAEGMGSTLRRGMAAVLCLEPRPDAVLLMVCDQPALTVHALRRLLRAAHRHEVVAAGYGGRHGVPAVFSQRHFTALATIEGDQGARGLLQTLAVHVVSMPEAALDLDTPEDLAALAKLSG